MRHLLVFLELRSGGVRELNAGNSSAEKSTSIIGFSDKENIRHGLGTLGGGSLRVEPGVGLGRPEGPTIREFESIAHPCHTVSVYPEFRNHDI